MANNSDKGTGVVLAIGSVNIAVQFILNFSNSAFFKILCVISTFATLFSFAWYKILLLDEDVHSFYLKERMRRNYNCFYGFGADEYYVLQRLCIVAPATVILFLVIGKSYFVGVGSIFAFGLTFVYSFRLQHYDSFFGYRERVIPLLCSCLGMMLVSLIVWQGGLWASILFCFFCFSYILCFREVFLQGKKIKYSNRVIVTVGGKEYDSAEN